jgi:hypothetical protein
VSRVSHRRGPRAFVVGLGISGIATAIRLRDIGWIPVIIERAPTRRSSGYFVALFGAGRNAARRPGSWTPFPTGPTHIDQNEDGVDITLSNTAEGGTCSIRGKMSVPGGSCRGEGLHGKDSYVGEQKDRMLRGEWYLDEPDLAEERRRCWRMLDRFNATGADDDVERGRILEELLANLALALASCPVSSAVMAR